MSMTDMTPKQRILNAMRGEEIDRAPWSPFLAYYWEHLTEEERACGQTEYLKAMGADPLLRGFGAAYRVEQKNCTITRGGDGRKGYTTFETKVGTLTEEHTYSPSGRTWFLTGHPVKTEEDFRVLQYLMENQIVVPSPDDVEALHRNLGEDGLLVPILGVHCKTAFQSLVERWCGTENLTYALYDFPEVVQECLQVMWEKDLETVKASANTSAEAFIFWEDSSTTNISPAMFEAYTAPELNQWSRVLHDNGKLLIHHACGHLRDIIPAMCRTGIDVIESISPPPTGNIDIGEAAAMMPDHVGLIGGIEPTFFQDCTMDELEARVHHLLDTMAGKRFVLANSDSCPPYVAYEKFKLVSEIVKGRG